MWPELNYDDWKATYQTLHRWTQIVGKIRLSKSPWINHSWHSTFYVTAQGLTTSVIHEKAVSYCIEFDLIHHVLRFRRSDGKVIGLTLIPEPVAAFHAKCTDALQTLGLDPEIDDHPNELPDAIPFSKDLIHCSYDPDSAQRFLQILLQVDRVMKVFRSKFVGKVSPVHLFWGSFDLAVTRFSGRRAPEHPGGMPHLPDLVAKEAYSHEVSSCGFWPGNDLVPYSAFYSYAYPKPDAFESAKILPASAFFHKTLREFILPYEAVRKSASPDEMLLSFFQSTYDAAANLAHWDRSALEDSPYLKLLQAA